jgi:hypothetical protein
MDSGPNFVIAAPDITLHCNSTTCGGDRIFRCEEGSSQQLYYNNWNTCFLTYVCRNCGGSKKIYALLCCWNLKRKPKQAARHVGAIRVENLAPVVKEENWQEAIKLGEWPPLGPIVPRKLLKLIESDRSLFDMGRRAEGQGMGIGAFAYYRRVVENQRAALFDKLISAAERLKVDAQIVEALRRDRDNWQFSQSLDSLKAVLPEQLKLQGQSPLTLLHNALSHNLHSESDETCLQAATDIRLVLTYLAEQLDSVLKDQTELEKAVGRLSRKSSRS